MTLLDDRHVAHLRRQGATDLDLLIWELFLAGRESPNMTRNLTDAVRAVLAGDGLMADRMQAEGSQPSVVPERFYNACNLLEKQGQTYKMVDKYLKDTKI